jgi:ferric-dicitrate binding protein FerR (iron transport regulator)
MDCWHPITVRAEKLDTAQRWAQLEGKSPLMREELAQRYAPRKPTRRRRLSNAAIYCELIAVALKAWWQIYGN